MRFTYLLASLALGFVVLVAVLIDLQRSVTTFSESSIQWEPIKNYQGPLVSINRGELYVDGKLIQRADVGTLEFVQYGVNYQLTYLRDRYRVYLYDSSTGDVIDIVGANPSSFFPFYDSTGPILYAKDKTSVFSIPSFGFGIGSTNVSVLQGADPSTFNPVFDSNGRFSGYAKDRQHVWHYLSTNFIPHVNSFSFSLIRGIFVKANSKSIEMLSNGYATDGRIVLSGGEIILGADPASFTALYTTAGFFSPYTKDKTSVFFDPGTQGYLIRVDSVNADAFYVEQNNSGEFNGFAHDDRTFIHNGKIIWAISS